MVSRPCQVVFVTSETPDTVDLGDVIGFVQYCHATSLRRGTVDASLSPSPTGGAVSPSKGGPSAKKESVASATTAAAALASGTPTGPVTLMFERSGLGGDPAAPVALEGEEFAAAILVALNRISEQHAAATSSAEQASPNKIVVIGCPSAHTIDTIANSAHDIRMMITVTSLEPFPAAPTAVPVKGAPKKPDAKKAAAAKGGKGVSGSATSQATVRLERYLKSLPRYNSGNAVRFLRTHCPSAAAAEGLVLTSIVPELTALESSYAEYSEWVAKKDVKTLPPLSGGNADGTYRLPEHSGLVYKLQRHLDRDRALGSTSAGVWTAVTALDKTVAQAATNYEAHHNPLRNVQRIDVHKLETMRSAQPPSCVHQDSVALSSPRTESSLSHAASCRDDTRQKTELPRMGAPMFVQSRPDLPESDPDDVQWLVRQFMKKSLGKLRPDSDIGRDLAERVEEACGGASASADATCRSRKVSTQDRTGSTALNGGIVIQAAKIDDEHQSLHPAVPEAALLLRRATTSYRSHPNTHSAPSIDDELIASVERSHTQREIQRGFSLTMLEQLAREEFPNLDAARFQTQSYVFSESISTAAMGRRIAQFSQRYGDDNIRSLRLAVDDVENVSGLTSRVSGPANLSKIPVPYELVVVGLNVPVSSAERRSRATLATTVSGGVPNFSQYVGWISAKSSHKSASLVQDTQSQLTVPHASAQILANLIGQRNCWRQASPAMSSKGAGQQAIVQSESKWTIYPFDSSVVEVARGGVDGAAACQHVRFAKDDLVATLVSYGEQRSRLTTTFDDGTVVTVEPRAAAQHVIPPPTPQNVAGDERLPTAPQEQVASPTSRASSSQGPSRIGTSQGVGTATTKDMAASRLTTAIASPTAASGVGDVPFAPVVDPMEASGTDFISNRSGAKPASSDVTSVPAFDVTVSYGGLSVSVDELNSRLSFVWHACNGDAKITKSIVEGTLDGETVATFVEHEVARTITHDDGKVVRCFASGSKQILFADGSVATLIVREQYPQPFWLSTSTSGEQFTRGEFPGAEKRSKKLLHFFCDVRQAADRENSCDIFSRADGVILVFYRGGTAECPKYHTRVVVHADGTSIVSRLAPTADRGVTGSRGTSATPGTLDIPAAPAMEPLMRQMAALDAVGTTQFLVESPQCPKVFLFSRRCTASQNEGDDSVAALLPRADREFFVEFGDGSVLKRQVVRRYSADAMAAQKVDDGREYLQTVFCKSGESTVRCHHDSGLVFVEPHSLHLSPMTETSIALCEGVGVFDLALGAFRLVDFKAHVTTVDRVFDRRSFPDVRPVVPSNETNLLLAMAPTGYAPHVLPKKQRDELSAAAEKERQAKQASALSVPPLVERLRDLTAQYIVEHRLISKGPRRSETLTQFSDSAATSRKQGAHTNELVASTVALMSTNATAAATTTGGGSPLFLTEVRPLLFAVFADGTATQFLSAQDVVSFTRAVSLSPTPITVSRTYCSGEPGIEQLTFVGSGVDGFGNQRDAWSRLDMSPTAGDNAPWLPRTLLPPRRYIAANSCQLPTAAAGKHDATRVLLRYQPLSKAARMATARQEVRRQDQIVSMHNYNASIKKAVCAPSATEQAAQRSLREKYLGPQAAAPTPEEVSGAAALVHAHDHDADVVLTDFTVVMDPPNAGPGEDAASGTRAVSSMQASEAASNRRKSIKQKHHDVFSFTPREADFGELIAGCRYALPVVLESRTTDTLLFDVFRPKRTSNGVQLLSVQTSSFILSPLGESTMYVMLNLPDEVLDTLPVDPQNPQKRIVVETLRMECAQLKAKFELAVQAVVHPSLSGVKAKLLSQCEQQTAAPPSHVSGQSHSSGVVRKPKVDTLTPPLQSATVHGAGYYGDLKLKTAVRIVGAAA